jgi:hypothetical protein
MNRTSKRITQAQSPTLNHKPLVHAEGFVTCMSACFISGVLFYIYAVYTTVILSKWVLIADPYY